MLVMIIAAVVRTVYLVCYADLADWSQLTIDNYYHHNWAQVLAGGDLLGDTTYFRAPFYVYCLAALYALLGASLWVGRIFGAIVGLASVLATYHLGRRVFNSKLGLAAAAIHAVWPTMLYFEAELLLDPLFALLMQLGVLMWLKWRDTGVTRDLALSGSLLGLACITRPTGLVVLVLLAVLALFVRERGLSTWRAAPIFLFSGLIFIAPIAVRNLAVAGDPVLIASQGGINLYIGNNAGADGVSASLPEPYGYNWRLQDITHVARQATGSDLSPGEISTYWSTQAWDWISTNPAEAARLYLTKLYRFVSNDEISNNRSLDLFFGQISILHLNPLSFATVFAFGIVALVVGVRGNRKVLILASIVTVYILAGALFFFSSRFRLPLMPYFFVLAAGGAGTLIERTTRRSGTALVGAALLTLAWLFSYLPVVALPSGMAVTGHISQGLHFYNTGDYETAREVFQRSREIDSTFPEVNLNLGAAYLKLGMLDSAKYYLLQELDANPERPKTYVNLASLALLDGHPKQASRALQPTLESFPHDVTARRLQLRIAEALSVGNDSLYSLARSAVEATDSNGLIINEAAAMLSNRGGLDRARQLLQIVLKTTPPPVETDDRMFEADYLAARLDDQRQVARAEYQLGYVEALSGNHLSAVAHSQRAIAIDSSMPQPHVNLISSLLTLGEMAQAKLALANAQRLFPDNPNLDRLADHIRENSR